MFFLFHPVFFDSLKENQNFINILKYRQDICARREQQLCYVYISVYNSLINNILLEPELLVFILLR